jgi:hypothetical protein
MRRLVFVITVLAACGGPSTGSGHGDASTELPDESWEWVDLPGMKCGNGSATGIAVNRSTRSDRLVLMFEGGGACWEAAACYGILIERTAVHLDGFTEQTFQSLRPAYFDSNWLFQRNDPTSPFHDATWVFVPYCTGDLHAGTKTTTYDAFGPQTMHHVGAHNVDAMLSYVSDFAPSEVFAIGISAGGYGVQLNWDRIAAAFPDATTHVLADGAQLVPFEWARWGTIRQSWAPRFPESCTSCDEGLDELAAHWNAGAPAGGGRHGLLASLQDGTLALFFGYDFAGMRAASLPIAQAMTGFQAAFMIDDSSHTLLLRPNVKTSTQVSVREWVQAWVDGSNAFETVGP